MTRILLTGAGGFAGHHALEHFLSGTDWHITCTDSFRHKGTTDRIAQVLDGHDSWRPRVQVITHDLAAPFSRQAFADMAGRDSIDYVLAYASQSHVDRSIDDPVPFTVNNVAVALNTLELCRQLQPKALVWVSTDEVYGPLASGLPPYREWSAMLPSNPYAASKAAQEALCIAYWRTYNVPLIIVNAVNLAGERQDPEKFVPKVIRAVLNGDEVTIHGNQRHVGTRYWLHARNLADGIQFLLGQDQLRMFPSSLRPARFNIGSPNRVDNLALAQLIAEAAGGELRYRYEDFHVTRPGHDPHYGLDSSKIMSLGWKPPVPFAESLARTVHWTLKHPGWLLDE